MLEQPEYSMSFLEIHRNAVVAKPVAARQLDIALALVPFQDWCLSADGVRCTAQHHCARAIP